MDRVGNAIGLDEADFTVASPPETRISGPPGSKLTRDKFESIFLFIWA